MMLSLRLLLLLCTALTLAFPTLAQEKTEVSNRGDGQPVLPAAEGAAPQWSRLSGTVEAVAGGVTTRAKIFVQAPENFRIDIERNDAAQTLPQTIIVSQDETTIWHPVTRRVQRLPYSVIGLRGWELQAGGPANFALLNHADGLKLSASGKMEREGFLQSFVSDYVQFGGSGDRIFYAPFKRQQWNGPARVTLEWKGSGPVQTRTAYNETGAVLSRAEITYNESGVPVSAVVTDAENRVIAEFTYDLKEEAEPFSAETFQIPDSSGQVVEELLTRAIEEYSGDDASSQFNRGVALMRQAEEIPAAYAAWEKSAKLAPQATAPHFALYETSLAARDLNRAETALGRLAKLLGDESTPAMWRRAELYLARREWEKAQSTLEKIVAGEPQNLQAKLSLADLLRARGEFAAAQKQLLELLENETQQSEVQAEAAQFLAELASNDAPKVLATLNDGNGKTSLWKKVAGAIIRMRLGEKPDSIDTENLSALTLLALEAERAGDDDRALALWQKVIERAPAPSDQNARAHLMTLYARRNDVTASLEQYRELVALDSDLKTRRTHQDQLLAAWRKAFRQDQLKIALEQRALATNAKEDDVLLWLTYQESFGSDEDVLAVIKNGLARFTRDAWWRSRHAEWLMEQAESTSTVAAYEKWQREALTAAESAMALDPSQPYYAIQRSLILTQRATPVRGILRAAPDDGSKKVAREALDALLKKWPNDPDVQIAVAAQLLALEKEGEHSGSIALLQSALREGTGGTGEDRHFISFSSRQILITALRLSERWDELVSQYEILFRAARTSDEQLGVALNYLRFLMNRGDTKAIANLLLYIARESWGFDESQQILIPMLNVVAVKEEVLTPTLSALEAEAETNPYAFLLLAKLRSMQTQKAQEVLAAPNAPDRAERDVDAAEAKRKQALERLTPLVVQRDFVLASRAAALLGEEALKDNAADKAEKWFWQATVYEPRDVNLRIALITAQIVQGKYPEALKTRDELLRALPQDFDRLHQTAKISWKIGEDAERKDVMRLAREAVNIGASMPEIPPGPWQISAYTLARAAFDAGETDFAATLYNNLAGPQWDLIERAVALIDLEESYRSKNLTAKAEAVVAQFEGLKLTPQQLQHAERIWDQLNR